MNDRDRNDGAAGLVIAILVLIVVIGIGATLFGVMRYRSAVMEAERARMQATIAEAQSQRAIQMLRDQENVVDQKNERNEE